MPRKKSSKNLRELKEIEFNDEMILKEEQIEKEIFNNFKNEEISYEDLTSFDDNLYLEDDYKLENDILEKNLEYENILMPELDEEEIFDKEDFFEDEENLE